MRITFLLLALAAGRLATVTGAINWATEHIEPIGAPLGHVVPIPTLLPEGELTILELEL
jgi:hypothetical protein